MHLRWTEAAASDLEQKAGARELVLSPLPWIVVYAIREEAIYIVRVLHRAERWP
jgi:plasmid stabilization system protein ParE